MTYYLAYGMLTNPTEMTNRCPDAVKLGLAILPNYKLRFRIHADIEPDDSTDLVGVLWDISSDSLKELDVLEGYPTYYTRKTVSVLYNSVPVDAIVYQMVDQSHEADPHLEYLDCCLAGYLQNGIDTKQLDRAYDSALFESTKCSNQSQYFDDLEL